MSLTAEQQMTTKQSIIPNVSDLTRLKSEIYYCKSVFNKCCIEHKNICTLCNLRTLFGFRISTYACYISQHVNFLVMSIAIKLFTLKINLQSLKDTQVVYILQKYTLNKYTLEKYTLKMFQFFGKFHKHTPYICCR